MTRSKIQNAATYGIYALALAVSISVWLIAIRAPLRLDETGSYWQISAGVSQIWSRQYLWFPAYSYILWLSTKIIGTSEIALRIPSVIAMLGAVYLLYRAASELFDREIALIAATVFSLNPIIVFASIDVRPYAFGALVTNVTILLLLRLRGNDSNWLAALFGLAAACILYFNFLFAVILPALMLGFFVVKTGNPRIAWRQFGFALAGFVLAFLPMIPGLHYLFITSGTHVYEAAPKLSDLLGTLAPDWLPFIFVGVGVVVLSVAALTMGKPDSSNRFDGKTILLCASLALIPVLLLYGVSAGTSIHTFASRHRMIAVPGIALCWALLVKLFPSRVARLAFCVALVAATAFQSFHSPDSREHGDNWKYALAFAEKNASADDAPVLICSGFVEADYTAMPLDSAKESILFAQISYYKLSVPVIPMPRSLNGEAIRVGSLFLQEAAQKHQRFLALEYQPYNTLEWLAHNASGTYDVRKLGIFNAIEVLEFVPRPPDNGSGRL